MRSIRLLLAPLALVSLATACGHDSRHVPSTAIAVVGDRTIARSQFAALMAQARQSYAARGRRFPGAGTAAYEHLKQLALALLVEQAELEQEAPRLGVRVDPAQVDVRLRELKDQSFGGSEQRYRERLRAAGMTDAQVRAALRAQLLGEEVRQAVTAEVTVSTESVQHYYESHLSAYSRPATRLVRHILMKSAALARTLSARLMGGADFAVLASRFSIDTRTRAQGGRLTLVQGLTAPGLDRVAFSLRTAAVSRPFHTRFGWELIQAVSPVRPARTTPFATVRDGIRSRHLASHRAAAYQHWLAAVRAKYARRTTFAPGFVPAEAS